ncbi:MAG: cysteine desulfurase [Lachnospiraceae bacterium]|nr:cysteine desulfurase [Lachnospiraceae bacterium]
MECYLDNAATTKPSEPVIEAVLQAMRTDFGNPSSKHKKGMEAEKYIRNTTDALCSALKCKPQEIILTSGGTESNNQALIGGAYANRRAGNHIISTAFEHAAVYKPLEFLESAGFEVDYVGVDELGHIRLDELEKLIRPETIIVSVMLVNNEVGAVQDIEAVSALIKRVNPGTLLHVDAIQAFGKMKIYPQRMGIDMLSISGHKLCGPKGSGALYVRAGVKLKPYIYGGGQQHDMRSGTENVPAIAGFGVAVKDASENLEEHRKSMFACKAALIARVMGIEGTTVNAVPQESLEALKAAGSLKSAEDYEKLPKEAVEALETTAPHILSVSFEGIDRSEVLLHALEEKEVYVSSGSACSSNHPGLSGSLKAIGVTKELLNATLRFSFSFGSTVDEVNIAADELENILPLLRRFRRK